MVSHAAERQIKLQDDCPIPTAESRDVEAEASKWCYKVWVNCSVNSLAPLNMESWQLLCALTDEEVKHYHERAWAGNLSIAN